MPRHTAPNHPDCYIDCPGAGFAYYNSPLGPCRTGCDPSELVDAVEEAVQRRGWRSRGSGRVRGITRREAGALGRRLKQIGGGGPAIDRILDDLENAGLSNGEDQFDAEWSNASMEEMLKQIRDASEEQSPLIA